MPLFKSLFMQEHLTEDNRLMTHKIKRQLDNTDTVKNFKAVIEVLGATLMAVLIVSFIFSFLLYGSLEYIMCLIRYM